MYMGSGVYTAHCRLQTPTSSCRAPVIRFLNTCVWVAIDMILNVDQKHVTRLFA